MPFYGVIQEIWELNYNVLRVVVFKCDWVERNCGVEKDELSFSLVDLTKVGYKFGSFIFTHQEKQVFYVED